ncbi:MAG: tetratricopeptide repeat protein [bacterium]|nr:tetratricopeptide repeat protein [bacterium]
MKKIRILIIFGLLFVQLGALATVYIDKPVQIAMKKYKAGNITGSLYDLQAFTTYNKRSPYAYYYLGMIYVKLGDRTTAKKYYQTALALNPTGSIEDFINRGIVCIDTPSDCNKVTVEELGELDKFIYSDKNKMSNDVAKEVQQKQLDSLRSEINSNDHLKYTDLRNYKDFSK